MNPILLHSVAIIYALVAIQYLHEGRHGMALAFVAYALANEGFAIDIWQF